MKRIETLTGLAQACGVTESLLYRLRRLGKLPAGIPDRGPWDSGHVTALKAWLLERDAARRVRTTGDGDSALKESRLRLLNVRNAIAAGRMLRRLDVERRWTRAAGGCRAALLALPRHVAAELVGKTVLRRSRTS